MKWLGKLFKRKKKGYNTDSKYKLLIINDEAELIHDILGVNEVRANEMVDICLKLYDKHDKLHLCLEELVSHCVHTNEIVYGTMIMEEVIKRKHAILKVDSLFKNMFGRG